MIEGLKGIKNARVIGSPIARAGVVSFVLDDIHAQDVGTLLDGAGVAVRTGKHCTEPLLDRLGLSSTVRASLGLYSNEDDVEALIDGLRFVRSMFD